MRRENYLYVGMDLHKETHTAVLVNCWNEILRTIEIANKPSEFTKLTKTELMNLCRSKCKVFKKIQMRFSATLASNPVIRLAFRM